MGAAHFARLEIYITVSECTVVYNKSECIVVYSIVYIIVNNIVHNIVHIIVHNKEQNTVCFCYISWNILAIPVNYTLRQLSSPVILTTSRVSCPTLL